ncbi:MAG: hypothetical protein CSB06_02505 [Bacteroidia bacterium]|nr:MAG: hypothetical protein CSB06_02505 [Bacteroidia bacterium]
MNKAKNKFWFKKIFKEEMLYFCYSNTFLFLRKASSLNIFCLLEEDAALSLEWRIRRTGVKTVLSLA